MSQSNHSELESILTERLLRAVTDQFPNAPAKVAAGAFLRASVAVVAGVSDTNKVPAICRQALENILSHYEQRH